MSGSVVSSTWNDASSAFADALGRAQIASAIKGQGPRMWRRPTLPAKQWQQRAAKFNTRAVAASKHLNNATTRVSSQKA